MFRGIHGTALEFLRGQQLHAPKKKKKKQKVNLSQRKMSLKSLSSFLEMLMSQNSR